MFPGQCGNTAFFFKSQPDQFHFEFRGIVFPGKSFFSAHEVSTCKISGCLSYRILDSGPDGTQTTLTNVIMMWDSEKQAIRNTMAAARRLASIGLNVKIACLGEEGLDPGEATQEQILKAYYRAKPYSKQLELHSKVLGIRVFNS
ncbi:Uncharacterised protein [Klebsiella pneumoniae]|nr:Uncharacterised protein [Klebsiella pneumoniae]